MQRALSRSSNEAEGASQWMSQWNGLTSVALKMKRVAKGGNAEHEKVGQAEMREAACQINALGKPSSEPCFNTLSPDENTKHTPPESTWLRGCSLHRSP